MTCGKLMKIEKLATGQQVLSNDFDPSSGDQKVLVLTNPSDQLDPL